MYFQWLKVYCEKVASLGVFDKAKPNHVLVNEYTPGQGIMVGNWGIPSPDGIPLRGYRLFFFFPQFPSAAKNGILGGPTHGRKPWIDLIF